MEQRKPHRLLQPLVTVDLDIGSSPEVGQIVSLLGGKPLPAAGNGCGQRGCDLVGERGLGANRRPAVSDELDQSKLLPGLERRCDRDPPEVGKCFARHPCRRWRVEVVLHRGCDP